MNKMLFVAILALGMLYLMGGASPGPAAGTTRAQRFELVDAAGDVRAVLGTDEEGATGLVVHDPEGRVRLSLTHDSNQSALFINDAEGTVRVGVAQFSHGGGGVALHGADAKGATVLYHKGEGSLTFYDDDGGVTQRIDARP